MNAGNGKVYGIQAYFYELCANGGQSGGQQSRRFNNNKIKTVQTRT